MSDTLNIRTLPTPTVMRFKTAARARGMTHAQYLAALVELHDRARGLADSGYANLQSELRALGLDTVSR